MANNLVTAVDLQPKRLAAGYTQETLGAELGVGRQQVNKYESLDFNIPIDKACESALLLDGLALEYKGVKFELRPVQEGAKPDQDEDEAMAGDWTSNAVNSAQQARELAEWSEMLGGHLPAIWSGRGAEEYLIRGYKEAREAQLAIRDLLAEGKRRHPDLVDHGFEMARRVAVARRAGRCQFVEMSKYMAEIGASAEQEQKTA